MGYEKLSDIVAQLEKCNYKTEEGFHDLKDNAAFVALKEISELPELNVPVINIASLYENLIIIPTENEFSQEVTERLAKAVQEILQQTVNNTQKR